MQCAPVANDRRLRASVARMTIQVRSVHVTVRHVARSFRRRLQLRFDFTKIALRPLDDPRYDRGLLHCGRRHCG